MLRQISKLLQRPKSLAYPYCTSIAQVNVTATLLTDKLGDSHLSMLLGFFNLSLGMVPNDRGMLFEVVIQNTIITHVNGI